MGADHICLFYARMRATQMKPQHAMESSAPVLYWSMKRVGSHVAVVKVSSSIMILYGISFVVVFVHGWMLIPHAYMQCCWCSKWSDWSIPWRCCTKRILVGWSIWPISYINIVYVAMSKALWPFCPLTCSVLIIFSWHKLLVSLNEIKYFRIIYQSAS
jgi:hypothetical protein